MTAIHLWERQVRNIKYYLLGKEISLKEFEELNKIFKNVMAEARAANAANENRLSDIVESFERVSDISRS